MSGRGTLAIIIPLLLLGIVFSQAVWHWIPAEVGGLKLWRVVSICFALWLFLQGTFCSSGGGPDLGRREVVCLGCHQTCEAETWQRRGRCPACGHGDYEFAARGAARYAQYLPGAVELPPPAPAPAPPTPIARPATPPRARLLRPVDAARVRVGLSQRRRIHHRLGVVMAERAGVLRV